MKKLLISWLVTPKRARKWIACILSWIIYRCILKGTWDVISALPTWLRKIADFIDGWNATELPKEKDRLIADLVADAVTDEAVDRLLDRVTALQVEEQRVLETRLEMK